MLSKAELHDMFYCEDGTLYWNNPVAHRCNHGDVAGSLDSHGYYLVGLSTGKIPAHKIVWAMEHGEYPEFVDHINGDRTDNRIENLRSVTRQQNNMNKATRSDNSSGVTGVRWHTQRKKWNARIILNGKEKSLGMYNDFNSAVEARMKAEFEYFGEYSRNYAELMRQVEAGTLVIQEAE